jgi:hypothetical protein
MDKRCTYFTRKKCTWHQLLHNSNQKVWLRRVVVGGGILFSTRGAVGTGLRKGCSIELPGSLAKKRKFLDMVGVEQRDTSYIRALFFSLLRFYFINFGHVAVRNEP